MADNIVASTTRSIKWQAAARELVCDKYNILHKKVDGATTPSTYTITVHIQLSTGTYLNTTEWAMSASTTLTGAGITQDNPDQYTRRIILTLADNTSFSGTITLTATDSLRNSYTKVVSVSPYKDGDNIVGFFIDQEVIMHKPTGKSIDAEYHFNLYLKNGEANIATEKWKSGLSYDNTSICTESSDPEDYLEFMVVLNESKTYNTIITFTLTYNGETYSKRLTVKTVEDGAKGDDAVSFVLSPAALVHKNTGDSGSSIYTIRGEMYKGGTKVTPTAMIPASGTTYLDGNIRVNVANPTSFYWNLAIPSNVTVSTNITFTAGYGGVAYSAILPVSTVLDGAAGERGPALRGPQDWETLGSGFQFYSGAEGEPYIDIIVYKDNYYSCKAAHTKGSTTPDQDGDNWNYTSTHSFVATQILLAKNALIKMAQANGLYIMDVNNENIQAGFRGLADAFGYYTTIEAAGTALQDMVSAGTITEDESDEYLLQWEQYRSIARNIMLWIGASSPWDANFWVDYNGVMKANLASMTNVRMTGMVRKEIFVMTPDNVEDAFTYVSTSASAGYYMWRVDVPYSMIVFSGISTGTYFRMPNFNANVNNNNDLRGIVGNTVIFYNIGSSSEEEGARGILVDMIHKKTLTVSGTTVTETWSGNSEYVAIGEFISMTCRIVLASDGSEALVWEYIKGTYNSLSI